MKLNFVKNLACSWCVSDADAPLYLSVSVALSEQLGGTGLWLPFCFLSLQKAFIPAGIKQFQRVCLALLGGTREVGVLHPGNAQENNE